MIGRVFSDRYRIRELVGVGPVSAVFAADDQAEPRQVAVKVFSEALADDDELVAQLLDAAEQAAVLAHPNIAEIYDWGVDGGPYVVTELCEGGSLAALLDQGGTLATSQALVMTLECARALNHGHEQGAIHRKLHPRNVLFTADERVRITDYGLAAAIGEMPIAQSERAIENVRYMSPEQARGREIGEASDLYTLALIVNEAVSGNEPPAADTVVGTLMERAESAAVLDASLGDLLPPLERCGRVDPDERPEAEELAIALLATAESLPRPHPLPLASARGQHRLLETPMRVVGGIPGPGVGQEPLEEAVGPDQVLEDLDSALTTSADDEFDVSRLGGLDDLDAFSGDAVVAPPELSLVSDEPAQGALENLEMAEPVFASVPEASDEPTLDIPSRSSARRTATTYEEQDDDADDQLPRWPLAVLGLLVAATIAAVGYFFVLPASEASDAVPELVGLPFDDVEGRLDGHTWVLERLESRVEGAEVGTVIAQFPDAGTELADGESVSVTVSLGAPMIEIPGDVIGLSTDQAASRLAAAGLAIGQITQEPNEGLDSGLVIGFDEPTTQKPIGEGVNLRVSSGPEDRILPGNLVGLSIAEATTVLVDLRLQAVEESSYSPDVPLGTVLDIFPAAGESVAANSSVILIVSAGPAPVEMPDIVGLPLDEAVDIIEELGLVFVDTTGTPGENAIGSLPPIGAMADVGTEVTIILDDPAEEDEDAG
jgi:serine/threonine-protein kinase